MRVLPPFILLGDAWLMFLSDPPASDLAEALHDEDRDSDGYVSNTTRLWCWRPEVLKDFFGVRSTLSGGSALSPADQAVLFAAAAAARSDSYCGLAWGTQLASHAGPDAAAQVMTGATGGLDPRGAALADWARRVARDPGAATPADISHLHDVGLTDQQIFEATVLIAWRVAFTAVNAALGAEPDAQLAEAAPAAVRAAVSYGRPPAAVPSD
jgi:alkylhydroperoxidase family enzyme